MTDPVMDWLCEQDETDRIEYLLKRIRVLEERVRELELDKEDLA